MGRALGLHPELAQWGLTQQEALLFLQCVPTIQNSKRNRCKFLSLVQDLGFYIHFATRFSLGNRPISFIFQHVKIPHLICKQLRACALQYNFAIRKAGLCVFWQDLRFESNRCPNAIRVKREQGAKPWLPRNGKQIKLFQGSRLTRGPVTGVLRGLIDEVCGSTGRRNSMPRAICQPGYRPVERCAARAWPKGQHVQRPPAGCSVMATS